jgi:hypothetical protein
MHLGGRQPPLRLDRHLGVTRQSVIKVFIAERLKAARSA